jgi:hypothetical protein
MFQIGVRSKLLRRRTISLVFPVFSASFKIPTICSSVNRDFRIQSSSPRSWP